MTLTEPLRAARYKDLFEDSHGRTADCAYCPICTAIGVVRKNNPEVLDHLAAAARELILAASMLLAEAGEVIGSSPDRRPEPRGSGTAQSKIRRIDIG